MSNSVVEYDFGFDILNNLKIPTVIKKRSVDIYKLQMSNILAKEAM